MSDNIFDVSDDLEVTIDENKDYVAELVGEGKKFKSVEDLAKGKYHSDVTITTLKQQLDELKQELNTRTSLQAFLDQMKAEKGGQVETPPNPVQPNGQQGNELDDSSLEAKLAAILEKQQAAKKAESNVDRVTRVMREQFGDQAGQVINHKAKELGMTPKRLQELAQEAPDAFFRLTGVSETPGSVTPSVPTSVVNNFGGTVQNVGIKNHKYFENLKRTNPKAYFDPKTTTEMINSRARLGQKYYE